MPTLYILPDDKKSWQQSVASRETLEHIEAHCVDNVLKELNRVLKIGGTALLMPANNFGDKETKKQCDKTAADESHLCVKPISFWMQKAEDNGFSIAAHRTLRNFGIPIIERWTWTPLVVYKSRES